MVHCGAAAAASTKIIDTRGRKEGRKERKEGRKEEEARTNKHKTTTRDTCCGQMWRKERKTELTITKAKLVDFACPESS
jgi:hypothetical protein